MKDCIFCKIIGKKVPAEIVKESENLIVIKDAHPKAETHLLIIPKKHVRDITGLDELTWVEIKKLAMALVKEKGMKDFRIVHNAGNAAAVPHMHVHLLGEVEESREI